MTVGFALAPAEPEDEAEQSGTHGTAADAGGVRPVEHLPVVRRVVPDGRGGPGLLGLPFPRDPLRVSPLNAEVFHNVVADHHHGRVVGDERVVKAEVDDLLPQRLALALLADGLHGVVDRGEGPEPFQFGIVRVRLGKVRGALPGLVQPGYLGVELHLDLPGAGVVSEHHELLAHVQVAQARGSEVVTFSPWNFRRTSCMHSWLIFALA